MKMNKKFFGIIAGVTLSFAAIEVQASEIINFNPDGCSKLNNIFTWSGWNNVCNTHDWQYTRFGTSRSSADSNLKNNLKKRCKSKYKWYDPRRYHCKTDADLVYAGVRVGGIEPFSDAQAKTESEVTDWVNDHPNSFAITTTYTPLKALWYTDQPIYKHHMDKKYVDLLNKVKTPGGMSTAEQWASLRDAISEGRDGYSSWKSNLLNQLGLKSCQGGVYLEVCPPIIFRGCGSGNQMCR